MHIRYEICITDPNDRRDRLDQPLRALKRPTFVDDPQDEP